MRKANLLTIVTFICIIFLFSCCSKANLLQSNIEVTLITSEKRHPHDFGEIAYVRDERPYYQYLVNRVNSDEGLRIWDYYELTSDIPEIDFENREIFLIGLFESGSCSKNIDTIDYSFETQEIIIHLVYSAAEFCTANATPRSFVIELEKEIAKELSQVTIIEGQISTKV